MIQERQSVYPRCDVTWERGTEQLSFSLKPGALVQCEESIRQIAAEGVAQSVCLVALRTVKVLKIKRKLRYSHGDLRRPDENTGQEHGVLDGSLGTNRGKRDSVSLWARSCKQHSTLT